MPKPLGLSSIGTATSPFFCWQVDGAPAVIEQTVLVLTKAVNRGPRGERLERAVANAALSLLEHRRSRASRKVTAAVAIAIRAVSFGVTSSHAAAVSRSLNAVLAAVAIKAGL